VYLLVVSANPDVPRLLATLVPDPRWQIGEARGAREALRTLVERVPDVLCADAALPDVRALLTATRRVPGGGETLVVLLGPGASTPAEADHVVDVHGGLLEILDLARAEQQRRAEGRPRPRRRAGEPSAERPTDPGTAAAATTLPAFASVAPPAPGRAATEPLAAPTGAVRRTPTWSREHDRPTMPGSGGDGPARVTWSPPPAASAPAAPQQPDAAAARKRLEIELRAVERAPGSSVLAIPRDSPPEVIDRALARMRERYEGLLRHEDPTVRVLAERMLARVDTAASQMHAEAVYLRAPSSAPVEVDDAEPQDDPRFLEGLTLLRASRWDAADTWFEAKRQEHPSEPIVLGALGLARYHNPRRAQAERESDGISLLDLALQFDPDCADAHAWLARVLLARNEPARARDRAQRALRLVPRHPEALSVVKDAETRLPRTAPG
jgi:hypothetical protein